MLSCVDKLLSCEDKICSQNKILACVNHILSNEYLVWTTKKIKLACRFPGSVNFSSEVNCIYDGNRSKYVCH